MDRIGDKQLTARQRKGKATKRAVLNATKAMLAEHDYHSIRLDHVAKSVGISKTSILWHYGSREELLIAAVLDLFTEWENALMLEKSGLPTLEDRLFYVVDSVAAYFEQNPEIKATILSLVFNRQVSDTIRERIIDHLEGDRRRLIEFLSGDDQTVTKEQASAIIALIHGCYIQWYADGCPDGLSDRIRCAYSILPLSGGST